MSTACGGSLDASEDSLSTLNLKMHFYKQFTEGSWSDLYVNKTYSEIPQSELSYLERCVASNMVSPIVEGTNKLYKVWSCHPRAYRRSSWVQDTLLPLATWLRNWRRTSPTGWGYAHHPAQKIETGSKDWKSPNFSCSIRHENGDFKLTDHCAWARLCVWFVSSGKPGQQLQKTWNCNYNLCKMIKLIDKNRNVVRSKVFRFCLFACFVFFTPHFSIPLASWLFIVCWCDDLNINNIMRGDFCTSHEHQNVVKRFSRVVIGN